MSSFNSKTIKNYSELGKINLAALFPSVEPVEITGEVISDAKKRKYTRQYVCERIDNGQKLLISRADGKGDKWITPPEISLSRELVAFFGLYSGDGTKGTEYPAGSGIIKLNSVSFEQREVNIVRFAMEQFRELFNQGINFSFSLGEDSAIFFEGTYLEMLKKHYGGQLPTLLSMKELPLKDKDKEYLKEVREFQTNGVEHDLRFYYTHKKAMEKILTELKRSELKDAGIILGTNDRVTASLRRPFKKGARNYGKSSRSDGMSIKGTNGLGELFLKILHSIEDTILNDEITSESGLIKWHGVPSEYGETVDVINFFSNGDYGKLIGERPELIDETRQIVGKWKRSNTIKLAKQFCYTPRLSYVSGLYLAEGTDHDRMISMYKVKPKSLSFSFTSSEDQSLSIVLAQLESFFIENIAVNSWKVKVGSQYFTELNSIACKLNVPLLRGGKKGQGKLKSVEVSIAIRDWALKVCPTMSTYADKFTHAEPTGAGVARIDFSSPSYICKWVFPIFMSTVFGNLIPNPKEFS
ncbi:hypothetical protein [Pseudoalteromonas pernae]|uniref:hypothetical protein n=1 Tax=Pseudoalteromonas pernae TaxID=3118054 RepID=UPI0032424D56